MMKVPQQHMSSDPDAPAIVEDGGQPLMSDRPAPPRRISGKILRMPEEPGAPGSGGKRMDPVPKRGDSKPRTGRRKPPLPDQEAAAQPRRSGQTEPAGYVRVRVRAHGGELSVQDIRHVEGPLLAHEELHGDLAYEAVLGGKRLSSGAVPDVGVRRSFPPPDPAPGQEGHYFTPTPSYEFVVRLPKDSVSEQTLRRVTIAVYRIKEGPVHQTEGPELLAERFPTKLREVGRIEGIRVDDLPKAAQAEARRALR
jgi:hypothetical protein